MSYIVITSVPDPGKGDDGNLATMFELYQSVGGEIKQVDLPVLLAYNFQAPVFTVSEILVCDETGREVAGAGRKPSKWFVEFEVFDDIESATTRALELRAW